MFDILIISPFEYALKQKAEDIKLKLFCDELANYKLHMIKAMPDEIVGKLHGKSFDSAYIDNEYIDEEVAEIRNHITGKSYKNIKFF